MIFRLNKNRLVGATLALTLAVTATGCDGLLTVRNPATVLVEDLSDPNLVPELTNTVINEFQIGFHQWTLYGGILSDEITSGHNFETIQFIDLRQIDHTNASANANVYNTFQRTRAASDTVAARLQVVMGDSAGRSLELARVRAYSALVYAMMGEFFCATPIDPIGAAISSDSLSQIAVTRARAAIQVANAYKAAGRPAARADSMINFARVAGARAALNRGDNATAIELATGVPANFQIWAMHSSAQGFMNNVYFAGTQGTNRYVGVAAGFRNLNDPRVRHSATSGTGHDQRTLLWTPFQPPSFSGHNPTTPAPFTSSTNIRIASGLEARYILAEAQGPTAANVAFVNERRAVGGMPALAAGVGAAEYHAALRDQRRRDFYIDGHRLGDLRRYKRTGQGDFFPTGEHPTPGRGTYGTSECFVPSLAERILNPNYP
jgi:hypothetical protein